MIIQAILDLVFGLLNSIILIFPTFNMPLQIVTSIGLVSSLFAEISYYFPVDTFVSCAILYLLMCGTNIGLFVINWVVRRIFDVIP